MPINIDPNTAKIRRNGRRNALIISIVFVFFLKSSTIFLGIAGTFSGYKKEIKATYVIYKNTSVIPGSRADVNKFPTDIFNTLPSKTSTTDGGIICPMFQMKL